MTFKANTNDSWKREAWRHQRIDRLIIDHLLRSGYFETAQKLAEQSDVEVMCNKSIFMIAKQVLSFFLFEALYCLIFIYYFSASANVTMEG